MFVLTAVSSINTSRAGSSIPCSRIHRRRARATSARCRSAACRAFFESDVVSIEKTPERTAAGFDPSLTQFCNRFYQGQVRLPGDQIQNLARELFQRRNAPAARLRGGAPLLIPALQPFYRRRHADLETLRRLASRRTGLHSCDNALPQVTRIGLRHPSPHKRRINAKRLPHSEPAGNPTDSNKPGTALGSCLGTSGRVFETLRIQRTSPPLSFIRGFLPIAVVSRQMQRRSVDQSVPGDLRSTRGAGVDGRR